MKTNEKFKIFYDSVLMPDLKRLDKDRKKVDRRVLLIGLITVALLILESKFIPENAGDWKFMVQPITIVLGFVAISVASKKYRHRFKADIIRKIAAFVDEDLTYEPEGYVSRDEFTNSGIFQKFCEDYKGEDYFKGHIGKTAIEFSELVGRHVTTSGSGSNKKRHYHLVFKGVFMVADFNKDFQGKTVVLPDKAEKLFGKSGQKLQAISERGQLIKLEDPEFEKEFVVYGDDQVEARYLLTPLLMQQIVEFKRKWKTNVYLSFRDSKLYIAIKLSKNLFETRLFKSIVDYAFIYENVHFLILLTAIVDDLNLNNRIWTKS